MKDKLNVELKTAMKGGEKRRVETIRMINAAVKDREIEARTTGQFVGDNEVMSVLQKMIKSRRESFDIYRKAGRTDLADREGEEIAIIESFLPQQMDKSDIERAVNAAIADTGATSIKDMGKVVATLKTNYAGRMDFGSASALLKTKLAS